MPITPEQCRAARGLLAMSQVELATASKVSLRTIQNFEANQRRLIAANADMLQRTLEAAGVEFIAANGGGPGVRLKFVADSA